MSMTVADNLVLNTPRRAPFAKRGTRNLAAVNANAVRLINEFDIRTESPQELVSSLSGGNQQKVIVARELSRDLKFLVASQPTRGLDVGSIEYVHRQMVNHRNLGNAALVVSSELDEVFALADRIAVMYAGKISGVVDPSVSRESIGLLMAGTITETAHD
jgi:simple sugar transport system ATP-binding protein